MKRNDDRVLGRTGARELTAEELARISGSGPEHTDVITFNPVTGQRDGDGTENVSGGEVHTYTMCSFDPKTQQPDGDIGEC